MTSTTTASLHRLVLEYRQGRGSKAAIIARVTEAVYREPERFGFDDEDAAADALLKYGRRLDGIIDRYEDRGLTFDAYVGSSLRFLAKTIRRDRKRNAERELVCERSQRTEAEGDWNEEAVKALESREEVPAGPSALPEGPKRKAAGNRLIFLFLKCVWDTDDEDVRRVALAAGVDPAWLSSAAAQARRSLDSERVRFERMSNRRNSSWCRMGLLETRIAAEPEVSRRRRLDQRLERERCRFARVCDEIRSFRPVVPNSIVARILGVPKGTVDSGIYYLRKGLEAKRQV